MTENIPISHCTQQSIPQLEGFESAHSLDSEKTTDELDEPRLKFVFWTHVPENAAEVAEQLGGCDVVALELLGSTDRDRQKIEQAATAYVSTSATPEERKRAEKALNWPLPEEYHKLLDNLRGSDKQIVTLDVNRGDEEHKLYRASSRAADRAVNKVSRHASNEKIARFMLEEAKASSVGIRARDLKAQSQVQALHDQYDGTGTKIGVVYGADHTTIYHGIHETIPSERVFVGGVKSPRALPSERYRYNSVIALDRFVRFFPDKPVPPRLLDAAMLDAMYAQNVPLPGPTMPVDFNSERMTPGEVSGLLEEIDIIKSSVASRLIPIPGLSVRSRVSRALKKNDRRQKP